jgi:hypothetical protein
MSYRPRWWRACALASGLVLSTIAAVPAVAQSVPNTLWLGTDNRSDLSVVNVTTTGAVVRSFGPREATGLAILGSNIWASTSVTQAIDSFDLNSLAGSGTITQSPGVAFGEDMASDGTFLYRSDVLGNVVYKVNATTGTASVFISGVSGPLGVAYTGSFFYVSEFNTGLIRQFTLAGAPTGASFTVAAPGPVGGLAWDSCTSTLWLASGPTGSNRIYNVNPTNGAILSSFASPNGRFADGLEYQGGGGCATTPTAQQVPTLSEWMLILLAGVVALTGALLLSRYSAR